MSAYTITLTSPIITQLIAQHGEQRLAVEGRFGNWQVRDILSIGENDPAVRQVQRQFLERIVERLRLLAQGQAIRALSAQILLEDLHTVSADYGIVNLAWQ